MAIAYFMKQYLFMGLGLLGSVLIVYSRQLALENMKKHALLDLENEFIFLFGFFRIFIDHHYNVYQALKALIPYASFQTKTRLEKLILDIDNDKTITPFLHFASLYKLSTIEQLLISVYQLVDQGCDSRGLMQFTFLFQTYAMSHEEVVYETLKHRLEKYQSYPLIAAACVTLLVAFGIVSLIGGMLTGF